MKTVPPAFAESTLHGSLLPLDDGLAGAYAAPARPNMFDACHVGVVLRAVLFVESVVGIGAMFVSSQAADWLW